MFDELKQKMNTVLDLVADDLKQVKTGRAKPSLIEDVQIEAYGGMMPLREVASINAPDTHLLVVSPWDKGLLAEIEKGLAKSNLGVNPVVDGDLIRIALPALTEERRVEMVKLVKQRIESGKQMLRGTRNDEKRDIENKKGAAGISEDDIEKELEDMQKVYEDYMKKLDVIGEDKEKELMQI
ncbi:ribosome recycling factor [Patescibacteria group bacterium]